MCDLRLVTAADSSNDEWKWNEMLRFLPGQLKTFKTIIITLRPSVECRNGCTSETEWDLCVCRMFVCDFWFMNEER